MFVKYRKCPCCHCPHGVRVQDLSEHSNCSHCNENIEVDSLFSVTLSAILLIICLFLIQKDDFVVSALILAVMALRSYRLDFFDALLMPLRKVRR